nr:Protein F59H6.5 [Haemonchus contortus]
MRLHSNARIQQRRRASGTLEERALRSQAEAMRLQRRRASESAEARAFRLQEDTQRHRRRRTLESERERAVRLQSNALANRQRRSRLPGSTGAALLTRMTEVNYLGELNQRCVECGALHFRCEVKASHPGKFRECCDLGRFTLSFFESFPEELRRLFVQRPDATEEFRRAQKNFLENIRNFNSALAMASMGAQVEPLQGRGPYCYRIHGQVYHRLGPLHPRDGEPRQYGQIYILDTELAAQERLGDVRNSECEPGLMHFLSGLLASVNVYAQSYKMMYEVEQMEIAMAAYENRALANIRMVFEESSLRGLARRPYDLPTANEVAVVYVGEDNDVPANRSLAVHLRSATGEQPRNFSDIDKICDPLTYPLLFPTGEGGWEPSLRNREGTRITQKEYYVYLFSIRDSFNPILYAGKLCQQFAVDAYVKIEQNRLNFQRRNQLILRQETFRG